MSTRIGGITIDTNDLEASRAFWSAVTGYEVGSTDESGAFLNDPTGVGTGIYLQVVPEPATAKNRVHLDIAAEDVPAEVTRIVELGATKVADHDGWTVLTDTDGNHFCIVPA